MNHDGSKLGYPCEAFQRLNAIVDIPVIASGGAGCIEDVVEVLTEGKADAALAASIFHFGKISIPQMKEALSERGIRVRL